MQINDLMTVNMILNSINKIESGYIIIDVLYVMLVSSIIFYFFQPSIKHKFVRKIEGFFSKFNKTNKLIFYSSEKESSKRYRSIMHYISKSNHPSVKVLTEILNWKYNRKLEDYEEIKNSVYRVDQKLQFIVDEQLGIEGKVYTQEKERPEVNGRTYIIYNYLEIFSTKVTLIELEKWVEDRADEYNQFVKSKSCDKQLLIEIGWDSKKKDLDIYHNPWESNVTFENRFFSNKDEILSKINFFTNNQEWYKKRGIPYTLGFLLWGEPGCGKTGFIKALMNLTGRHGISIKLNNNFNMNKLREIIFDDEICEDLIIPQRNRILIFEDIDCMGEVLKERDNKEVIEKKIKIVKEDNEFVSIIDDNDNNLSFFLNILDGLQESPGRIIIMTTNKPEQLDKALIRPGRIDYNINFTKATLKDIKDIVEFYWNDNLADELPLRIDKILSHAEIVNICRTSKNINETIEKILSHIN